MERSKWGRGFKRKRNQPHTLKGGMCWLSLYSFTIAQKLPLTTPDHKWQLHFTTPSPSKVHFDPGNAQNRGNGGLSFAVSCICFTTKHFYRETWRLKFPLVAWHEKGKKMVIFLKNHARSQAVFTLRCFETFSYMSKELDEGKSGPEINVRKATIPFAYHFV